MKYNIQEELDKFKLLTKYDSSKTLNENMSDLNEQEGPGGNPYMPYITNNPPPKTQIVNNDRIKTIAGVYCEVKKRANNGVVTDRDPLIVQDVSGVDTWGEYKTTNKITDAEIVEVEKLCPKVKPKVVIPIPPELNNVAGVQAFQNWLDGNVTNWATDYPGGKVSRSPKLGYGSFGKRTKAQWDKPEIKDAYLKFKEGGGSQNSTATQAKPLQTTADYQKSVADVKAATDLRNKKF